MVGALDIKHFDGIDDEKKSENINSRWWLDALEFRQNIFTNMKYNIPPFRAISSTAYKDVWTFDYSFLFPIFYSLPIHIEQMNGLKWTVF